MYYTVKEILNIFDTENQPIIDILTVNGSGAVSTTSNPLLYTLLNGVYSQNFAVFDNMVKRQWASFRYRGLEQSSTISLHKSDFKTALTFFLITHANIIESKLEKSNLHIDFSKLFVETVDETKNFLGGDTDTLANVDTRTETKTSEIGAKTTTETQGENEDTTTHTVAPFDSELFFNDDKTVRVDDGQVITTQDDAQTNVDTTAHTGGYTNTNTHVFNGRKDEIKREIEKFNPTYLKPIADYFLTLCPTIDILFGDFAKSFFFVSDDGGCDFWM